MLIERHLARTRVRDALERSPVVVVLTGPRQAGKTTLARELVDAPDANFFDLEDPRDEARLGEPTLTLPALDGNVVIDEAQRRMACSQAREVLARWGGEFLLLLPGATCVDAAARLQRMLDARTGACWRRAGRSRSPAASRAGSFEGAMAAADVRLRHAKRAGKARVLAG